MTPGAQHCILIDLDGTLCNHGHRVNFAIGGRWTEFHEQLEQDRLHKDVAALVSLLHDRVHLIAVTGRNERYRQRTLKWLAQRGVLIDELLMRPDDNFDSDTVIKPKLVYDRFGSKEEALAAVTFILDDREKVVEAWRDAGFNCWAVRQGEF